MKFEHFALNVADKSKAEQWYTEHLHLSVVRSVPGNMSFLADVTGRVILEIYQKSEAEVLPYAEMHPLMLHIAFSVDDVEEEVRRLQSAGATLVEGPSVVKGDLLAMLRDPFGLAIQLVKRQAPMN
jgi:catechol 2,3-dioxygenase-like lactoylglutathione lyase family enzyme